MLKSRQKSASEAPKLRWVCAVKTVQSKRAKRALKYFTGIPQSTPDLWGCSEQSMRLIHRLFHSQNLPGFAFVVSGNGKAYCPCRGLNGLQIGAVESAQMQLTSGL